MKDDLFFQPMQVTKLSSLKKLIINVSSINDVGNFDSIFEGVVNGNKLFKFCAKNVT